MRFYRRNGFWLRLLCAGLVFAAGCANAGPIVPENASDTSEASKSFQDGPNTYQTNQARSPSNEPLWLESARRDLAQWPDRIVDDSQQILLRADNVTALLLAGGASVVMNQDADKRIADHFARHRDLRNFRDESLNVIGHPGTHTAAAGLWYVLSAENQDELNRQRAERMLTAVSLTWAATAGLKTARDNESPNGKDRAWPSGHTSSSFAVASVLDEFYGPKVGIPAYAVASLVAYRMMDTGDHWGSDIVFGATLGWVVGHTVAAKHNRLEVAGFKVVPYVPAVGEPAMGISLLRQF